jgi:hypothetical protein
MSSHTDIYPDVFYAGRAYVEIRTDPGAGGGWFPISNVVVLFESPELERMSAETFALGATDLPIVTVGKRQSVEVTLRCIFDDDAGASATAVWGVFVNAASPRVALRWKPRGTGIVFGFVTSRTGGIYNAATPVADLFVPIIKYTLPELDPSKADPAMFSFTVRAPTIVRYATANDTVLDPAT